ncbi:MAG: imidazole glycerol phosphate synthase subunit HisF [Phycisphaeraceae bacterium]|nr:imidazole glycerol phosphate synthase subunit HisF [Phycisphaeraceae bacterium]
MNTLSTTRRLIPCLDVRDGRVVKGVRFASLRDAGDPAQRAAIYEAQDADEIVMLDVSATLEGRPALLETVRAVRRVLSIPLTVGGGVRTIDDAQALLNAGADKVSVNSAAVRGPSLLARLSDRFGAQCVVLAIDAVATGDSWRVATRSGSTLETLDAADWASQGEALGAGEILLTSFDRDGTRSGYDLGLLRTVCARVGIPVIASGGASSAEHIAQAFDAGADAALAASIFHDNDTSIREVKRLLAARGIEVRPC